jgi:hypothetical protein
MMSNEPYTDVDENPIHLRIQGTDKGDVLGKLSNLNDLLDQASAWSMGAPVDVVYIEYQPTDSDVGDNLKAIVKGPPSFGSYITTPGHFDSAVLGGGKALGTNADPIILQFRRSGLWYGTTVQTSTSSTSTGNPAVNTPAAFANTYNVLCPYNVYHQYSDTLKSGGLREAYLITTNAANKIALFEAEANDEYSSGQLADAVVANASAGNLTRYTPSTGTPVYIRYYLNTHAASFDADIRQLDVFTLAHNHSTETTFYITPGWYVTAGSANVRYGRTTIIDTTNYAEPRPVYLGRISFNIAVTSLEFYIKLENSGTLSNYLELDYFCLVGVDDSTNVLHLPWLGLTGSAVGSLDPRIHADHRVNTHISPLVWFSDTSNNVDYYTAYEGNARFWGSGNTVSSICLGVTADDYVVENSSNTELNTEFQAVRTPAYLIPE